MVLPLLLGLMGSGMASAGMLGTLGPLLAGSIGSGLGSYAETGDLEKGIMTGLGSFAGGSLLGPVIGGKGASAAATAAPTATAPAALTAGTNMGGTVTGLAPQLAAKAAQQGVSQAAMAAPLTRKAIDTATATTAASAGGAGSTGIAKLIGNGQLGNAGRGGMAWMKTPTGMGQMAGSMVGSMVPSMFGGKEEEGSDLDTSEKHPLPRTYSTPPTGYRAGYDPEWNYGLSNPQSSADIRAYTRRNFAAGGIIDGMDAINLSGGGIADLAPPPDAGGNEKQVVVEAIKAIKGQSEDPRIALGQFLQLFGEDALRDLAQKVEDGEIGGDDTQDGKGMVRGPGDGMDDRVPARISDTGEDVMLADSEYVVPADVVSHLGNGSSDAGAKALDDMLHRVRQARTGQSQQAPAIAPQEVMPA